MASDIKYKRALKFYRFELFMNVLMGHLLKHMLRLVVLLLFCISCGKCEENITELTTPSFMEGNNFTMVGNSSSGADEGNHVKIVTYEM